MMPSYLARLFVLALAAFFLVHLLLGIAVSALTPAVTRRAHGLAPLRGARLLFAMRMAPLTGALLVTLGVCVPSYLQFEPLAGEEEIGAICLVAAILGALICVHAVLRAARAAIGSVLFARRCRRNSQPVAVRGAFTAVSMVRHDLPIFALTGVFRPHLLVSNKLLAVLSSSQLEAALDHEQAHVVSHDNLKRLLLMLAPDVFPFVRAFRSIERCWARFSEWAADDYAAAGDERRSLFLADALIRVARIGSAVKPALTSSFLADDYDLAVRVDRLLHPGPATRREHRRGRAIVSGLVAAAALAVMLQPATLRVVHAILEHLID